MNAKQLYEIAKALKLMSEQFEEAAQEEAPPITEADLADALEIVPGEDIQYK